MSDNNDYIKSLQKELEQAQKDKEALASELKAGNDENNAKAIQEAVLPHVPGFISNIVNLAHGAASESVQLSANKLLIEWVVGGKLGGGAAAGDDEFRKLLEGIKKKAYDDAIIPPEKAGK